MFEQVRSAAATLEGVVRDFEPGLVDGSGAVDARRSVRPDREAGRSGQGPRGAAGRRDPGVSRRRAKSAAALARGTYRDHVRRRVRCARAPWSRSTSCPRPTRRSARVSSPRRKPTRSPPLRRKAPGSEADLLRAAKRHTVKGLTRAMRTGDRGGRDRRRCVGPAPARDSLPPQVDEHGRRGLWPVPADARAAHKLWAALDDHQDRIFRAARAAGRREPAEAYAADVLVALAVGRILQAHRDPATSPTPPQSNAARSHPANAASSSASAPSRSPPPALAHRRPGRHHAHRRRR